MERYKVRILNEKEIKEIEEIIKKILVLKNGGQALVDTSLLERIVNDVVKDYKYESEDTIRYMAVKYSLLKDEEVIIDDNVDFKNEVLQEETKARNIYVKIKRKIKRIRNK